LRLEEARVGAAEYRDTVLQGVKLAGETIGTGVKTFLGDKEKVHTLENVMLSNAVLVTY
jgi:ATPase family AAA domain-containing protein 3A/B